jgi:Fe2+ or Zn2+ uptake regulation protein
VIRLEKYVKLLKDHDLKITSQRLSILKYLDEHKKHPTADDIYLALKKHNPALSKTTVYNALEALRHHKLIQLLTISGSESRYEFTDTMHHHFLCKNCGRIIDIAIQCPNIEKISAYGHRVEEVHGYFKGLCQECIQKDLKKHEPKNIA